MSQDKLNSTDRFVGGLENFDGNYRAAGAISAGDPVEFDGTETGNVPDVSLATTSGSTIAGVALHDASAAGDPITLAQTGAQVRTNSSSSTAANPGDQLVAAGNGSVIRQQGGSAGDASVGVALSEEVGNEVVMLINMGGDFHG